MISSSRINLMLYLREDHNQHQGCIVDGSRIHADLHYYDVTATKAEYFMKAGHMVYVSSSRLFAVSGS